MDRLRKIVHYLLNLEWTEKKQHTCKFCDRNNFKKVVFEDSETIAFENRTVAGKYHWLVVPLSPPFRHVRDIEGLEAADIPLLMKLDNVKETILSKYCPNVSVSQIHSGYHRGRRLFMGNFFFPDIVSVHHIHLHIIVEPRPLLKLFKYPSWLPLMWRSDKAVLRNLMKKKKAHDLL